MDKFMCSHEARAALRYFGVDWQCYEDQINAEHAARRAGRPYSRWTKKTREATVTVLSGTGFARQRITA